MIPILGSIFVVHEEVFAAYPLPNADEHLHIMWHEHKQYDSNRMGYTMPPAEKAFRQKEKRDLTKLAEDE
jgi:hypothetical protein